MSSISFDLNLYFEDYVVIDKKERSKVLSVVMPKIDVIVSRVAELSNGIFSKTVIPVGSHFQGLKAGQTNEFDFNIVLQGIDNVEWVTGDPSITYGFKEMDDDEKAKTTARQNLTIVEKGRRLCPDNGYGNLQLGPSSAKRYAGLAHDRDLVPYKVKQRFRQLLTSACDSLDGVSVCQQDHGPALTVTVHSKDCGLPYNVSVDFAPTIRAQLQYLSKWGWPRVTNWPSRELVQSVLSVGVNLTGKQNFFWLYSFAEMEKKLSIHIDQDGGCRKKVHRISKVLFKNQWRSGSSLSTYELKNAWLRYCEESHYKGWTENFMGARFVECAQFFCWMLRRHSLPQYFNHTKNLLEGKAEKDLNATADKIEEFLYKHKFLEN